MTFESYKIKLKEEFARIRRTTREEKAKLYKEFWKSRLNDEATYILNESYSIDVPLDIDDAIKIEPPDYIPSINNHDKILYEIIIPASQYYTQKSLSDDTNHDLATQLANESQITFKTSILTENIATHTNTSVTYPKSDETLNVHDIALPIPIVSDSLPSYATVSIPEKLPNFSFTPLANVPEKYPSAISTSLTNQNFLEGFKSAEIKKGIADDHINHVADETNDFEEMTIHKNSIENSSCPPYAFYYKTVTNEMIRLMCYLRVIKEHIVDPVEMCDREEVKKYKIEIRRIINMNVNTLSALNASHLMEKIEKFITFLRGDPISYLGKTCKPLRLCEIFDFNGQQHQPKINNNHNNTFDSEHVMPDHVTEEIMENEFLLQCANMSAHEKCLRYLEYNLASAFLKQGIKQIESNLQSAHNFAPVIQALSSVAPSFSRMIQAIFLIELLPVLKDLLFDSILYDDESRKQLYINSKNENQEGSIMFYWTEELARKCKGTVQLYLVCLNTPLDTHITNRINFGRNKDNKENVDTILYSPELLWFLFSLSLNTIHLIHTELISMQSMGGSHQHNYTNKALICNHLNNACLILLETINTSLYTLHNWYKGQALKLFHCTASLNWKQLIDQIYGLTLKSNHANNQSKVGNIPSSFLANHLNMLVSRLAHITSTELRLKQSSLWLNPPEGYLGNTFWANL